MIIISSCSSIFRHSLAILLCLSLSITFVTPYIEYDVSDKNLIVALADGSSAFLLTEYYILPTRRKINFTTVNERQDKAKLDFYIGTRELASANKHIGTLYLEGLGNQISSTIEIIVEQESDRSVQISASSLSTGKIAGYYADDGSWQTEISHSTRLNPGYTSNHYAPDTDTVSDLLYIKQGQCQVGLHTGNKVNQTQLHNLKDSRHPHEYNKYIIRNPNATLAEDLTTATDLCCRSLRCYHVNHQIQPIGCIRDYNPASDVSYASWWALQKLRGELPKPKDQCFDYDRTKALSVVTADVFNGIVRIASETGARETVDPEWIYGRREGWFESWTESLKELISTRFW